MANEIERIVNLKSRYMELCDKGYPPKPLAKLFVDDGVWTSPTFGTYVGKEQIEGFFAGISSRFVFAAHLALNPIIDVSPSGTEATGRWRCLMPFTENDGDRNTARWILGDYDEAYVRQGDQWLFRKVDFFVNFNVPHQSDWASSAIVRPTSAG